MECADIEKLYDGLRIGDVRDGWTGSDCSARARCPGWSPHRSRHQHVRAGHDCPRSGILVSTRDDASEEYTKCARVFAQFINQTMTQGAKYARQEQEHDKEMRRTMYAELARELHDTVR